MLTITHSDPVGFGSDLQQQHQGENCGELADPAGKRLREALTELGQMLSKDLEPPARAMAVGLQALHDAIHTYRSTSSRWHHDQARRPVPR